MITLAYVKTRYPTLYSRLDKKTADAFINTLILEAFQTVDQSVLGSRYYDAIRLTVASNIYKEINRASVAVGTTGLETSRSVSGQYSVSYANDAVNAVKGSLGANLNEYEVELENIYRSVQPPFYVG